MAKRYVKEWYQLMEKKLHEEFSELYKKGTSAKYSGLLSVKVKCMIFTLKRSSNSPILNKDTTH